MEGQTISTTQKKKPSKKYERFGEIIRHFTLEETNHLFDSIDNYTHKLMFEVIYELGCRVGEFVRIQVKHFNFSRSRFITSQSRVISIKNRYFRGYEMGCRSTVFFPAENTKTKHARISYLPKGLTNEIKSMLKQKGLMSKRGDRVRMPEAYLFHSGRRWNRPYTENRIRQIFQIYVNKAGLQQVYGKDSLGRNLKMFTVHSLRHSHIFSYIVDKNVALPIVQKQVGHRSLKTTSVYLMPSTERMAEAYRQARLAAEGDEKRISYKK